MVSCTKIHPKRYINTFRKNIMKEPVKRRGIAHFLCQWIKIISSLDGGVAKGVCLRWVATERVQQDWKDEDIPAATKKWSTRRKESQAAECSLSIIVHSTKHGFFLRFFPVLFLRRQGPPPFSDYPSVSVSPLGVLILLDNTGLDIIILPRKTQCDIFSW